MADTLRQTAADTLLHLRSVGIEHLIMLTGDNLSTADAIANEVGMGASLLVIFNGLRLLRFR